VSSTCGGHEPDDRAANRSGAPGTQVPKGSAPARCAYDSRTSEIAIAESGLTAADVAERIARGDVNDVPEAPSRTTGQIVRANVLTRFNALIGSLFVIVIACGAYRDALFGGVIVANTLIGIVQELRAKRTLDRLVIISAPKVTAVRDGEPVSLAMHELVLDDVLDLRAGQQIAADSAVLSSHSLEVDESLLTGESDPVLKQPGDELLSGSFVVSGAGRAQVTKVGADAYGAKLAAEAKRFTLVNSELRNVLDRIVRAITWVLVPTGIALFVSQFDSDGGVRDGLVAAVGGVVAMVPEGLILLTSVAFAVGVVRLAGRRTLVQELPAIEVLARVDVIYLDKTGTITSGAMDVSDVRLLDETRRPEIEQALAALAWSDPHPNATQAALQRHFPAAPEWTLTGTVAFSSARKWSAASFDGHGTWVLGAPEFVLVGDGFASVEPTVVDAAEAGHRVLAVAVSNGSPVDGDGTLPGDLAAAALILLDDEMRPDASETLEYFAAEGVELKVISGDNPRTVGAVCRRVGLPGAEAVVDARELPADPDDLADAMLANTVFGRVSPHQKQAMVKALQSRGHVVAMTGDGVNDVLALKDADCGIAMASGSEASRAVAQVVLLDDSFTNLPAVLAEGRRVINNIERVASLFLVKTTYAQFFALATILTGLTYPFLPRHLTLIGSFTIGVPAFFLALAPNADRVRPGFLGRVLRVAIPGGLIASIATFVAYFIAQHTSGVTLEEERSTATLVLAASAIIVLARVARPLRPWKIGLIVAMASFLLLTTVIEPLRDFFEIHDPPAGTMAMALIVIAATTLLMQPMWAIGERAVGWGERRLVAALNRRRSG
jgi:cation-transporting ATPase E